MGLLTSVKETVLGGDETDEASAAGEVPDERPSDRRGTLAAVESAAGSPGESASKADFVATTGHSREDVLVELVEANGGRVKQSDLVRLTGWSKATVSRYLSGLETDGTIDRVPVGRCKVVLLPEKSLLDEPLGSDHPDETPDDAPASDPAYPRT